MIAIILKELRESLKWAGLIAFMVLSAMAWAVHRDLYTGLSLVGTGLENVCVAAFPVAGFALGMRVILPDARRGRWQFVMHRPIDRSKIFAAKVLAGGMLYSLATVIPLVGVAAWIAAPGHVPGPVTFDMLLPRLADLIGGLVSYAAGLLVASRTSRWFGSRLIPIGFALLVTILSINLAVEFWQYFLIAVAGVLIFLIAARRAFIGGGEVPRSAWVARSLLGISLATGWTAAAVAGSAFGAELLSTLFPSPLIAADGYLALMDDGSIVQQSMDKMPTLDYQGRPIHDANAEGVRVQQLQTVLLHLQSRRLNGLNFVERASVRGFHNSSAHLQSLRFGSDGTKWFYVVARNSVQAIDGRTWRQIGGLIPAGWSAMPQSFPEQLDDVTSHSFNYEVNGAIAISDRTVWKIGFDQRSVRRIFQADPGDEVVDASYFFQSQEATSSQSHLPGENVIVTRRAIYVFKDGETPVQIPLSLHWPTYYWVSVGRTLDGRLAMDFMPAPHAPRTVVFADGNGKVLQQVELPSQKFSSGTRWEDELIALAVPPGLMAWILRSDPNTDDVGMLHLAWTLVLCTALLSVGLALPLARRREYSTAGVAAWGLLCLLLGIPGVLLLLSMDDAVPAVRCSGCGRQRPVSREHCPHCAAPFAAPKREGIEIFVGAAG